MGYPIWGTVFSGAYYGMEFGWSGTDYGRYRISHERGWQQAGRTTGMYVGIYLVSVFIASISQILLKKSALKQYDNRWKAYINRYVIVAYMLLFFSMFLTIFAYRGVELKLGPVLEATSYLYVAVLSYIFLQEHISKRKKWGLVLIILGIVVSNLG